MTWILKMQRLKNEWDSLPEARRGGGIEELIEMLLDKVTSEDSESGDGDGQQEGAAGNGQGERQG